MIHNRRTGENQAVVEIKLKRGESIEKALRRLKKKMDKEGTMKEIRGHRYFEKPSEKRAREKAAAVRRARKMERKRMERDGSR